MSRPARRADRHRRCARCGLEKTYPDATVAEAQHWFSSHSCRKREEAAVRTAMAQAREALVDRTPKPCRHKKANHVHGTRACYVLDRCRCHPCAKANTAAANERTRLKAYGRYQKYVDAYPIRLHLQELKEYGIGLKRVSELSGVSNGSLTKIWYGLYEKVEGPQRGCKGAGDLVRGPSRRVLRTTAERIYAVEPIPANLGSGVVDHERTPLARTHLRSLIALGWTGNKLAQRLEVGRANFTPLMSTDRPLTRGMVDRIEALYVELCMTPPTAANSGELRGITMARRLAKANGWKVPLDLDDLDVSEVVELDGPAYDEAVVERVLAGDLSVLAGRQLRSERAEIVRRLKSQGLPHNEITRRTGIARAWEYAEGGDRAVAS